MERFFVYDLIDPRTDEVFYVGKGMGRRPEQHTAEALKGKRSSKCERIRAILDSGQSVRVSIARRFTCESAAYAFEVERIADIGLANLTNVLPGGQGGRMAKAVKRASAFTTSAASAIARVLLLEGRGKSVYWGGMNVTAFAHESLWRLVEALGLDFVNERLRPHGVLLSGASNALR